MSERSSTKRSGLEWFSSLPACVLLLAVVVFATGSDLHNRMLQLGDVLWQDYYQLRADPELPRCDPDIDVEAEVVRRMQESFGGGLISDLVEPDALDPDTLRQSIEGARQRCANRHNTFESLQGRMTPALVVYRQIELAMANVAALGLSSQRYLLALLLIICAATATFKRHHIAMRGMETQLDHKVSFFLQTIANIMLLMSSWFYRQQAHAGGGIVTLDKEILHDVWIVGFLFLSMVSCFRLFRPPAGLPVQGNLGHALLSVPLYTTMCLISGSYFAFLGHSAGIGIYLDKMMELSDMFLNIGLYVWVGMMLKHTRLARLVFDIFRPWRMPPELLAAVAVAVAAIPTAYTGASGIFVIAAGAVIYAELRSAGARRQLALAATAMSGSLGVVLRPCLLVVIIAYLNREVTTDLLFGWGIWVFLLTVSVFLLVSMTLNRQGTLKLAPWRVALPASLVAARSLLPYAAIVIGVLLVYSYLLDVSMDEFSAPRILPVMMLGILIFESIRSRHERRLRPDDEEVEALEPRIRKATNETTGEIGALLLLFGLSVSLGGVIERAGVMGLFPESFASPWLAMALMVCVLVMLGMIMDAFGAVILVSTTVATIAYQSGIDPVHFWMVTLVAFELGYLTPPVALNHLLTRQVVGEDEVRAALAEGDTFYQRHERILMPLIVMGISLVLVAFMPLLVYL